MKKCIKIYWKIIAFKVGSFMWEFDNRLLRKTIFSLLFVVEFRITYVGHPPSPLPNKKPQIIIFLCIFMQFNVT